MHAVCREDSKEIFIISIIIKYCSDNMKKLILSITIRLLVLVSSIGVAGAFSFFNNIEANASAQIKSNGYGLQWMMEYGDNPWTDARYQGLQPIGDCDNDGKNEINAGNVDVNTGKQFTEGVCKYDWGL
jgi:hypothetical protein